MEAGVGGDDRGDNGLRPALAPRPRGPRPRPDGAGAAILEREGEDAALVGLASVNDTTLTTWRLVSDLCVRTGDQRYGFDRGHVLVATEAASRALAGADVAPRR